MKAKQQLEEFRGMEIAQLNEKASSLQHELMNLRFRKQTGQLTNTATLGALRQQIARVKTVIEQKRGN